MPIWKRRTVLSQLNDWCRDTLNAHIGIRFTQLGDDFLAGTMPVDHRTHQPMGILHGGASVALAESLGSMAAHLAAPEGKTCVGLDINANHLRRVRTGTVTGYARALHVGNTTQVWEIKILNEREQLVCIARLTVAVIDAPEPGIS